MVHYKLCYFNVRGRAEGIRYILAQAGVDFEDHRVDHEEWAALKPKAPMSQLPILYVGDKVLCQSIAIARFVAKEHGLVPDDHFLAAKADMLVDGLGDQSPHISSYAMAIMRGDTKEAGELWKDYQNDHVTPFLDMLEKFLTENGGKYFVGDRLTWADLLIGEFIDRFVLFNNKNDSILAGHKKLAQHTKLIHELPNIKKYVANRPQTLV